MESMHEQAKTKAQLIDELTELRQRVTELEISLDDCQSTEATLRESEERFRQMAESADEVFWLYDLEAGKLLYVNPAYERTWGQTVARSYADAGSWQVPIHPEDREHMEQAIKHRVRPPYEADDVYRIITPDGDVRWIHDQVRPVHDESGNVYRLLGVVRDITERKQLERQQLELVLERERSHILTDFITSASHEFRTPLSVIRLSAYLLSQSTNEKSESHLRQIEDQVEHIANLVDAMVLMTRLDSDDPGFTSREVDLNAIVRAVRQSLQPAVEEARLSLTLELSHQPLRVQGDFEYLNQAILHLGRNAIQHTPAEGQVTLRSKQVEDQAVIEITDTGTGIEAKELPRIFERFYRADTSGSTRGFGLGLPMAKAIVEHHRGRIEVESEVGQGSTFRILLPLGLKG
jgi:PAS domain S-box-containing protein